MPGVPQSILVGWLVLHFAFAITQGAFAGFIGLDQQDCATPQRWICGTPLEPLTTAIIDFEFGIGIILEVFSLVKDALITIFRLVILDYEILYWGGPLGVVSLMIRAIAGLLALYATVAIALKVLFLDR